MITLAYDVLAILIGLGIVLAVLSAIFWGVIWLLTAIFHR